jgi:hypothetical protein
LEDIKDSLIIVAVQNDITLKQYLENAIAIWRNKTKRYQDRLRYPHYSTIGADMTLIMQTGECRKYQFSPDDDDAINSTIDSMNPYCKKIASALNQMLTTSDPLDVIGEQLVKNECGERNFYLLLNSEIKIKFSTLKEKYAKLPFYKGYDEFFPHRTGWKISKHGPNNGAMIKRLEAIVRSGIHNFIKSLFGLQEVKRMQFLSSRKLTDETGFTFKHFRTVLYVYVVGLMIGSFFFGCEIFYLNVRSQNSRLVSSSATVPISLSLIN